MNIYDKHGHRHRVTFGREILLGEHVVSHVLRTHNSLILKGFTVPHELRRRSIGSVLLHAIERHYSLKGVTHVTITQQHDFDTGAHVFLEKNGYRVHGHKADRILQHLQF